jgi:hypothetical protein
MVPTILLLQVNSTYSLIRGPFVIRNRMFFRTKVVVYSREQQFAYYVSFLFCYVARTEALEMNLRLFRATIIPSLHSDRTTERKNT